MSQNTQYYISQNATERFVQPVGSSDQPLVSGWSDPLLCVVTGQLGVEAGLEKSWVTVRLHQVENLLLRQLEGGGANAKAQALIGCLSDGRVHIDLEKKQLCQMSRWTNMFDYKSLL